MAFIWVLLMALFQAPLDRRLSYASVGEVLAARVPSAECIQTHQVRSQQRLLLAYHSGRRLAPADIGCNWLLVETRRNEAAPHRRLGQAVGRRAPRRPLRPLPPVCPPLNVSPASSWRAARVAAWGEWTKA
jgi:hypothetical protein